MGSLTRFGTTCALTHRRTLEAHRVLCEPAGRLVVAHHSHRRCIRCQRLQRTSAQRHSPAAAAVCHLSGAVRVQYSRCVVQHDATCCILSRNGTLQQTTQCTTSRHARCDVHQRAVQLRALAGAFSVARRACISAMNMSPTAPASSGPLTGLLCARSASMFSIRPHATRLVAACCMCCERAGCRVEVVGHIAEQHQRARLQHGWRCGSECEWPHSL